MKCVLERFEGSGSLQGTACQHTGEHIYTCVDLIMTIFILITTMIPTIIIIIIITIIIIVIIIIIIIITLLTILVTIQYKIIKCNIIWT